MHESRSFAGIASPPNPWMKPFLIVIAIVVYSNEIAAQPAFAEIEGVIWERTSPYVANSDSLRLYEQPDLQSEVVTIPYRNGWRIPVSGQNGMTRVLSVGELRVTNPDENMICSVEPRDGPTGLIPGEFVEYLRYIGEGFGEIRFRGATCQAEVAETLGHFELIREPEFQMWVPVYYADGTSPGWLLNDGTQTN